MPRSSSIASKPRDKRDRISNRTIRVPDSFWREIQDEAEKRKVTVSDLVVEAFALRVVKFGGP